VFGEERKEPLLSGHESLKPAKHGDISTRAAAKSQLCPETSTPSA
jgi:hypothetical protein